MVHCVMFLACSPAAIACAKLGISTLVVPAMNSLEAALIPGIRVIAPGSLKELIEILQGDREPEPVLPPASSVRTSFEDCLDFSDIRGQSAAKRALEIAAAGGHNVLMSGAPGSGKLSSPAHSGASSRLFTEEAIEVTQIYSVANLLSKDAPLVSERPFRLVHHTASGVPIVGGGQMLDRARSAWHTGAFSSSTRSRSSHPRCWKFSGNLWKIAKSRSHARRAVSRSPQQTYHGGGHEPAEIQRRLRAAYPAAHLRSSLDRIDLTIDVQPVPIEDLQKKPRRMSKRRQ